MFEFNANFFVVAFAFTGGLGTYLNARKGGTPVAAALKKAASMTTMLVVLKIIWAIALNAMHLPWNSIAGYGLGLVVGFAGLVVFLAFKSFQNRRRHSR